MYSWVCSSFGNTNNVILDSCSGGCLSPHKVKIAYLFVIMYFYCVVDVLLIQNIQYSVHFCLSMYWANSVS